MVNALDSAITLSQDTPDALPVSFNDSGPLHSGHPGRPSIDIQFDHLTLLSAGCTGHQEIADLYQCSARTIWLRLLEYRISTPGPPVYTSQVQEDGSISHVYAAG